MESRPRLLTACLARNEADRFLPSALEAWGAFSDHLVLLDDGSTDATPDLAREAGATVYRRSADSGMWGKEANARAQLWECALESARASECEYVLILDADMTCARDPRPLLTSEPDAVAFTLYDLWSENEYRTDGYWKGHNVPRVWLVRVPADEGDGWVWPERGVHCGHFPTNLTFSRIIYAPADFGMLHYAYSHPVLCQQKAAQYMSISDQLSDFERAHASSILHPAETVPLPFTPDFTLRLP